MAACRKRREPPACPPGALARRSPEGIRTLATAVRGRRPRPLDDGAVRCIVRRTSCHDSAGAPGGGPERGEPPAGRPGVLALRSPEGIRTLATAVRGRRPGPLDD